MEKNSSAVTNIFQLHENSIKRQNVRKCRDDYFKNESSTKFYRIGNCV